MARPTPVRRPDPVQRLRVRYAKLGPARFASHRDIARALERAIRRAEIPVAYSSGFSPHPRLSYANPAPTGAASRAEYLHIGLAQTRDPDLVRQLLTRAMPAGLPITSVVPIEPGEKLADLLTASAWRVELGVGVDPVRLTAACARLVDGPDAVIVRRQSGRGERVLDVRAALRGLSVDGTDLMVLLAHGEPSVRPDDVVAALGQLDSSLTSGDVRFTRLAQGRLDGPAAGNDVLGVEVRVHVSRDAGRRGGFQQAGQLLPRTDRHHRRHRQAGGHRRAQPRPHVIGVTGLLQPHMQVFSAAGRARRSRIRI
jgi:radical SAM-linked protein